MIPATSGPVLWLAIGAGLLVLMLILARLLRGRRRYPYQACSSLLSAAELRFFRVLEQVLAGRVRIYAKVRLADLIRVRPGLSGRTFFQAFNAIACKHIDYVLCDDAHRILCAIELDDSSHARPERRQRDAFVDAALNAAGIPLLRFPVQARYELRGLRQQLQAVLGKAA